jgi:menaquinone-dependent protoporphyrinogen oxidase
VAAILILYSTVDGHTLEICRRLQQQIRQPSRQVELLPLNEASSTDLDRFDTVVIGASIRYGKHRPAVHRFVERHRQALDARRTAFFSVNVVARKPQKNRPETNPYVGKFLRQTGWQPTLVEVFAGKLDYRKYSRSDRLLIRFIMWLTNGPTDPDAVVEFTDWTRVEAFGQRVASL